MVLSPLLLAPALSCGDPEKPPLPLWTAIPVGTSREDAAAVPHGFAMKMRWPKSTKVSGNTVPGGVCNELASLKTQSRNQCEYSWESRPQAEMGGEQ